jgi:GNAT superfamily N-acetyltransferase
MEGMTEIAIRVAGADDLTRIAAFRWDEDTADLNTAVLNAGDPAEDPADGEHPDKYGATARKEFITDFVDWALDNPEYHCVAAFDGDAVVGMAWLAELPRIPSVAEFDRAGGDIQSVFVLPEYRNKGIGAAIMHRINKLSSELGLRRVTVNSSTKAVALYERAGFASGPKLLARDSDPEP